MTEPLYAGLLAEVADQCRKLNQELQPQATPEDIDSLCRRARSELDVDVPEGYVTFLRLHDGLDWNGLMVYASHTTPVVGDSRYSIHGLVEANIAWRGFAPHREFLFFAESGVDIYCLHLASCQYQITDRQSGRLNGVVASFEHLIVEALRAHRLFNAAG
jgi:hypothetical protein